MPKSNVAVQDQKSELGKILKTQRKVAKMTLYQLADLSGVSVSHLARIEGGSRFPSAMILKKIAGPLGFDEDEIFTLAGYLTPPSEETKRKKRTSSNDNHLDPYVALLLSKETIEMQRRVIDILALLKEYQNSPK